MRERFLVRPAPLGFLAGEDRAVDGLLYVLAAREVIGEQLGDFVRPAARQLFERAADRLVVLTAPPHQQRPVHDVLRERVLEGVPEYIHTVAEALKLALADRDEFYGDPDFARVPAVGLLSDGYAAERRKLIDPMVANNQPRAGDPWKFQPSSGTQRRPRLASRGPATDGGSLPKPLDTTTINVADARGNLFSASPSSAWFSGGTFIAGDTGVPLGNRMQAFVLDEDHPNVVRGGKPFLALSSPGGDSQEQQALQVILNVVVFGMRAQEAVEAPRFNTFHYRESFRDHRPAPGALQIENRIAPGVGEALGRLGHRIGVVGPFMMDTGTALVGVDADHGTLFGAADVRRQRFVMGW